MGTRAGQELDFETEAAPLRGELIAHCYRMLGSPVEAEDAVQETYLRAWRAFHDFDGRSSVRTWMYRIATNQCLTALGAASRRILPSALGAPPGDPTAPLNQRDASWLEPLPEAMLWQSAAPTPEESLITRENLTLAWTAALQSLPPNQRAVLLLRDVLAFSAQETADTLGTSVASVNSALQRCRSTLADAASGPSGPADPVDASDAVDASNACDPCAADAAGRPVARSAQPAVQAFVDAFEKHDFDAIVAALAEDCTWQMPPFDRWYLGNDAAARLAFTHCPARAAGDLRFLPARANGQPALGMYLRKGRDHEAFQFVVLDVRPDGLVQHVVGWFDAHLFRLAGLPLVLRG